MQLGERLSWLIDSTPARHAAHRVAAAPEPILETRTLPSGRRLTVAIDPGTTGPNQVTVRVATASGRPDRGIAQLTMTASNRKRGIDLLPIRVRRDGAGRWRAAAAVLPLPGRWSFAVSIRRGQFDEERTHVDADITRSSTP